jgi:hypothetical protein
MIRTLFLIAVIITMALHVSFGQIPRTLSYQGLLTDTEGVPRQDGIYSFTFRFYTLESGGTPIWEEMQALQVQGGLFSAILGSVTPFGSEVMFDGQYWLSVEVEPDPELSPRIPLTASGYSFRAGNAEIAETVVDGSITTSKLATNSIPNTPNQVLTWNGTGLSWQVPAGSGGLSLPYEATVNQSNAAFSISNDIGDALRGFTQFNNGVYGFSSAGGNGISGYSETGFGVIGFSNTGISGVYGESKINGGAGVWGVNNAGAGSSGIWGESTAGNGVRGNSQSGMGIRGASETGTGVYGTSTTGYGLRGVVTQSGTGVYGENTSNSVGAGVQGRADYVNSSGVYGISTSGIGVRGTSSSNTGVVGSSTSGVGVLGQGPTAMKAEGNALQDIGSGGWAKAMLLVRDIEFNQPYIERCYNGVTGQTSNNCGFTISQPGGAGPVIIGAPFKVVDRFFSITLLQAATQPWPPTISFRSDDLFGQTVVVSTGIDASFYLIIY